MEIPLVDLHAQYRSIKEEIDKAIAGTIASSQFILGPEVKAFEAEMAAYIGVKHAVGVASGTDALHLAMLALGIGPGDEVITTPFTFIATVDMMMHAGARPVFVDIDPETFNLDPSLVEAKITRKTKAILPVHLYGLPTAMDPILALAKKHNLLVIEDCAQALGALYKGKKVGSLGEAGCLSFFPSKSLGAYGDGGMVVTDSPEVAGKVDMLRRHGAKVTYYYSMLGFNSRLDGLQAAILRVKLRHLDEWTRLRRTKAARYREKLGGIKGIGLAAEPDGCLSS
jgi:dTDP-4-amino-4,6-dideoxygalactose transaminase